METPNDRLAQLRAELGFVRKALFAEAVGIERASYDKMEKGPSRPSFDSLEKILAKYPHVNTNWILTGKGGMFLGAAPVSEPQADWTTAAGTLDAAYLGVLKEQIADLKADKARLIEENEQLRGKSGGSPEAAGRYPYGRGPVGHAAPLVMAR